MQDWVVDIVRELGPFGIGLLMFAENVFPPLPSELIMPLAGYLSAQREFGFLAATAAGALGSLAGATFWYWIGRRLTAEQLCERIERHGAWLAMTTDDVDRATKWFRRHGRLSVLVGRMIPVVRTLISVPAGFSRMRPRVFLLLSAVGVSVWTTTLAYAGRLMGQRYGAIERYVGPVSSLVVAILVVTYIVRVARIHRAST